MRERGKKHTVRQAGGDERGRREGCLIPAGSKITSLGAKNRARASAHTRTHKHTQTRSVLMKKCGAGETKEHRAGREKQSNLAVKAETNPQPPPDQGGRGAKFLGASQNRTTHADAGPSHTTSTLDPCNPSIPDAWRCCARSLLLLANARTPPSSRHPTPFSMIRPSPFVLGARSFLALAPRCCLVDSHHVRAEGRNQYIFRSPPSQRLRLVSLTTQRMFCSLLNTSTRL